MGYFSNGAEGDFYRDGYCFRCVNWRDNGYGEGCPIMDLHMLWNSDAVGKEADKTKAEALDHFIARGEIKASDGIALPINKQCVMYLAAKDNKTLERLGQEVLLTPDPIQESRMDEAREVVENLKAEQKP